MTVRLINPQGVSFAGKSLPGCREARLTVKPRGLRTERGDEERYSSYVEVESTRYEMEIDCEDVGAAVAVSPGESGALSFAVEKADGSGTVGVSAGNAVAAGHRTRFRNGAEGVSVTTLRFVCRSGSGSTEPVSIS